MQLQVRFKHILILKFGSFLASYSHHRLVEPMFLCEGAIPILFLQQVLPCVVKVSNDCFVPSSACVGGRVGKSELLLLM